MCERAVRILCYIREIWRARHLQQKKNVVRHGAKLSDGNFVCGASDDPCGCVEIAKVALAAGTKKKNEQYMQCTEGSSLVCGHYGNGVITTTLIIYTRLPLRPQLCCFASIASPKCRPAGLN